MYSTIKYSTNAFYSCKVILGRISLQSPSHMAVHIQFSYNFLTTRVNYYELIWTNHFKLSTKQNVETWPWSVFGSLMLGDNFFLFFLNIQHLKSTTKDSHEGFPLCHTTPRFPCIRTIRVSFYHLFHHKRSADSLIQQFKVFTYPCLNT